MSTNEKPFTERYLPLVTTLAISHNPIRFSEGELIHHELSGSLASEVQDAMHKVSLFVLEHGNPYATDKVINFNNFVSRELGDEKATIWI